MKSKTTIAFLIFLLSSSLLSSPGFALPRGEFFDTLVKRTCASISVPAEFRVLTIGQIKNFAFHDFGLIGVPFVKGKDFLLGKIHSIEGIVALGFNKVNVDLSGRDFSALEETFGLGFSSAIYTHAIGFNYETGQLMMNLDENLMEFMKGEVAINWNLLSNNPAEAVVNFILFGFIRDGENGAVNNFVLSLKMMSEISAAMLKTTLLSDGGNALKAFESFLLYLNLLEYVSFMWAEVDFFEHLTRIAKNYYRAGAIPIEPGEIEKLAKKYKKVKLADSICKDVRSKGAPGIAKGDSKGHGMGFVVRTSDLLALAVFKMIQNEWPSLDKAHRLYFQRLWFAAVYKLVNFRETFGFKSGLRLSNVMTREIAALQHDLHGYEQLPDEHSPYLTKIEGQVGVPRVRGQNLIIDELEP